jgi:tetratricopeptide (TPR) repeat protein
MNLNARNIGLIVGALVILGGGIYFAQQASEKKEQTGKSALYNIQRTYDDEVKALPEGDRAPEATLDVDTKFSKTVSSLNGMLSSQSAPSVVLYEAAMRLGNLYLDHGQADKAVPAFQKAPEFAKTNFQKASGFYLLGVAQERSNQSKEALNSFEQTASKEVDGLKAEALLEIVRINLKLNDKEKAKLYSEKLNKEAAGSSTAMAAEELVKNQAK